MLHRWAKHHVKSKTSLLVFAPLVLIYSVSAWSSTPGYYTVDEKVPRLQDVSLNPVETLSEVFSEAIEDQAARIPNLNLLNWFGHPEALEDPAQPYNRKEQFGTWIRERNDGTCFNTRAKVLSLSSSVPVTLASHGCAVIAGRWHDPYSDRVYTRADDMQIDHVVP